MQNLFDRLAAISIAIKVGALLLAIALLGGGYYYFFYGDMMDEMDQLQQQTEKLEKEKKEYEKRKAEYLAFRNEVNALLEEQKELLRVLPKSDDIEQFIDQVQAQIEMSGLTKVQSVRESAQPVEMYVKIPVRMSLTGTYHQINLFFKQVGDLKRIVNIEDLGLTPAPENTGSMATPTLLNAKFLATTFMFQDKGHRGAQGPAKGPTTQITSGGNK